MVNDPSEKSIDGSNVPSARRREEEKRRTGKERHRIAAGKKPMREGTNQRVSKVSKNAAEILSSRVFSK